MGKYKMNLLSEALSDYNLKELQTMFVPLARKVLRGNLKMAAKLGLRKNSIDYFINERKLNKSDSIALCLFPFATKELYHQWRAELEEDVRVVWDLMLWEEKLNWEAIFNKTNIKITKEKEERKSGYRRYGSSPSDYIRAQFSLFKTYYSGFWDSPEVGIMIPNLLSQILVGYYDPPENSIIVAVENPEPTDFVFQNSDQVILSEISRIYLYYSQKNIAVTGKTRPKHTTIPKMNRTLNLKEFFPKDTDKKLKHLRTGLLAGIFVLINTRSKPDDILKYLMEKMIRETFFLKAAIPALLLTDLKGMGYFDNHHFEHVAAEIIPTLEELPEGWIEVERILNNLKFNLIGRHVISKYYASDKLHYVYKDPNAKEPVYRRERSYFIDDSRYELSITNPVLKGFFFYLSALGLVDLAYDRPNRESVGLTCQSAYDGLRYIRLTPLGLYFLGHTTEYDLPKNHNETSFVFSPDALTITLNGENVSDGFVLEPYATRVGPNRFATESSIFLKDIKSKKSLEQKIMLFRQVTKIKMPANWEDFFKEMLKKVDPFEPLDEQFLVYKLPESNKDLLQLIARDEKLKKYSLKAEGYHVLVSKSNNAAFKKRLLEFGYLVT